MKTIFVDTNIFLRLYLNDIPEQAKRAKRIFKQAEQGKVLLTTNALVIFECNYALDRLYGKHKTEVVKLLNTLLDTPGLYLEQHDVMREALQLFTSHSVGFVDAYNVAWGRAHKVSHIFSFDKDFKKIPGIKLIS